MRCSRLEGKWWRRRVLHSGPQRAWGSRYLGQLPPAPQSAAATGHVNSLGIDLATVDDTWREVGGTVADRTAEVAIGMASPRAELLSSAPVEDQHLLLRIEAGGQDIVEATASPE